MTTKIDNKKIWQFTDIEDLKKFLKSVSQLALNYAHAGVIKLESEFETNDDSNMMSEVKDAAVQVFKSIKDNASHAASGVTQFYHKHKNSRKNKHNNKTEDDQKDEEVSIEDDEKDNKEEFEEKKNKDKKEKKKENEKENEEKVNEKKVNEKKKEKEVKDARRRRRSRSKHL
jgi:hypothetical protein